MDDTQFDREHKPPGPADRFKDLLEAHGLTDERGFCPCGLPWVRSRTGRWLCFGCGMSKPRPGHLRLLQGGLS